jgi:hypothetical protein
MDARDGKGEKLQRGLLPLGIDCPKYYFFIRFGL